jgi:xanthine dehydrogenase molybdopterin-binding subunit B
MSLLSTHAPSTFKIPATGDILEHFKVDFWHEPNRENNVFGGKAVGEPPFMLAISVLEALKERCGGSAPGCRSAGCAGDGREPVAIAENLRRQQLVVIPALPYMIC